VKGLKEWPKDERPPVAIVFWSFRIMVGLGSLMALVGLASLWLRFTGRLYASPLMLRAAVAMGPAGFIAILAGWVTTEVGRQPFTVYGLLRTADSVSPIALPAVSASLAAFVVVYFIVFGVGTMYLLRMMARAPAAIESPLATEQPIRTAGITPGPALPPGGSLAPTD
ncbi:MAG: cytochrome ubiquinol oxidase subunit I, partial [Gammaproteobacteria bacterium]|nr:cytochrome ubiquinol oxidase subunit I [Gammaproteobacteria bacterium]